MSIRVVSGGISIIIPCYNAASSIISTLDSLQASSLPPAEIICVDDASTDGTPDKIRAFAAHHSLNIVLLIQGHRGGAAAARNRGAREAQSAYLLFLDADVVVERTTLECMQSHLLESDYVAVVGHFQDYSLQPGSLAHFQAATVHSIYARLDPSDSPCFGTQCVLMKTAVFYASRGFDEKFNTATVEDFDFGYYLRAEGYRICVATDARIIHNHPYTLVTFIRNYYGKARDLTTLLLDSPNVDLMDIGYHDSLNMWLLGVASIQILFLFAAFAFNSAILWLSFANLLSVFVILRKFVRQVAHRWGLWTGLFFGAVRFAVTLIGWAGTIMAMIAFLLASPRAFVKRCLAIIPQLFTYSHR